METITTDVGYKLMTGLVLPRDLILNPLFIDEPVEKYIGRFHAPRILTPPKIYRITKPTKNYYAEIPEGYSPIINADGSMSYIFTRQQILKCDLCRLEFYMLHGYSHGHNSIYICENHINDE